MKHYYKYENANWYETVIYCRFKTIVNVIGQRKETTGNSPQNPVAKRHFNSCSLVSPSIKNCYSYENYRKLRIRNHFGASYLNWHFPFEYWKNIVSFNQTNIRKFVSYIDVINLLSLQEFYRKTNKGSISKDFQFFCPLFFQSRVFSNVTGTRFLKDGVHSTPCICSAKYESFRMAAYANVTSSATLM